MYKLVKFVQLVLCKEGQNLQGCTAVFLIVCRQTFQRYVLPPSSERALSPG
jgi:hypothetical protein